MQNIAVSLTQRQVANSVAELLGQPKPYPHMLGKTVTRRIGWADLQSGALLCLVEKGMGLKPGEKVKRLGLVHVTNVRRERLDAITPDDVKLEGFKFLKDFGAAQSRRLLRGSESYHHSMAFLLTAWPKDFISFFCATHKGATPSSIITRIEWEYVGGPAAAFRARNLLEDGYRFNASFHVTPSKSRRFPVATSFQRGRDMGWRCVYPDGSEGC